MIRDQDVDDSSRPEGILPRWKIVLVCLAMCLGAVTIGIDAAIIAPAVPFFAEQWHAFRDIGWFGAAYILPQIVLQSFYGRLLYFVDAKWSYLAGIFGLQVGSVICAFSHSSSMFIVGRALAGISVAILTPAGMAIITRMVAKPDRPLVVACIFGSMAISTFGSVLGGFFVQSGNWRWMFFLNFPAGAVVALLMVLLLPGWPPRGKQASWAKRVQHLDLPGCALLISALTALCLSLHYVASTVSWTAPEFIGCLVASVCLMLGFLAWQIYGSSQEKLIPRAVFANRTAWIASALAMLINTGAATHCFLLPSFYQIVRQESPLESGLKLLPYLMLVTFGILLSGVGVKVVGFFNPFLLFGCVAFLVGAILLDRIDQSTMPTAVIGFQVLCGFGIGCSQLLPIGIVQQSLDEDNQLEGTALVVMFQFLGSTIGISLSTTILSQQMYDQLIQAAVPAGIAASVLQGVGMPSHMQNAFPPALVEVTTSAFTASLQHAFKVAIISGAASVFGACFLEWRRIAVLSETKSPSKSEEVLETV